MRREIDILLQAESKGCLIVEKATHVLWEREKLLVAEQSGLYQEVVPVSAPGREQEVTGPYPGCLQARGDFEYRALGETKHFVIFYRDTATFQEESRKPKRVLGGGRVDYAP